MRRAFLVKETQFTEVTPQPILHIMHNMLNIPLAQCENTAVIKSAMGKRVSGIEIVRTGAPNSSPYRDATENQVVMRRRHYTSQLQTYLRVR